MSISKALLVKPRPCPFCNYRKLELRAVVFREWNIHCRNSECNCKGPTGKTPDIAVTKWNSLTPNCLDDRKSLDQLLREFKDPNTVEKMWRAIRKLREFTIKEIAMMTSSDQTIVKKYIFLLEENDYLKISESNRNSQEPNIYRCLKPRKVKPPNWLDLQMTPRDFEIYRQEKKSLAWKKLTATNFSNSDLPKVNLFKNE